MSERYLDPPPRRDGDAADHRDGPGSASQIASVVAACPLVGGLHGGDRHSIVTDSGGARVIGVLIARDVIVIGVTRARFADLDAVIDQVRKAVCDVAPSALVSISVRDDPESDPAGG